MDFIHLQKQFFLDYKAVLEECLHDEGEASYLDLKNDEHELFEFTNISNFFLVQEASDNLSDDADDDDSASDMTVDNNSKIYKWILSNIPVDLVAEHPQDATSVINHKDLYKAVLEFSPINPTRNPRTYFDLNDLNIGWSTDHFKYEVYLQVMDVMENFWFISKKWMWRKTFCCQTAMHLPIGL